MITMAEGETMSSDSLIDNGFPALTEVDILNTTYKQNEYYAASPLGIEFNLSTRIFDIPVEFINR